MLRKVASGLVGLALMASGSAMASSVSGAPNQAPSAQSAAASATTTSGIISSGIAGAVGGTGAVVSNGNNTSYASFFNSRDTGRNAGAADKPFGVWVQAGYTSLDNGQRGASFDGDVVNLVGGFDYKLSDRLVIGIATTYETVDLDTNYLAGRGKLENDGFGLAPYVGFKLTDKWTADATFGYSWLSYDAKRTNNTVSGSFDAERWFINSSLNGAYSAGSFRILPKIGVLYMEEQQDGYRENNGNIVAGDTIKLGRLYAGGRLGYAMNNFMPYVKLIGEYDFEHPDSLAIGNGTFTNNEDVGGQVGLGVDFFSNGPLSGSVETSYNSLGRQDLDVWSVSGRLRVRF